MGALAKLKGPRAIAGLVTALRDADRQVRTHAAKVLGDVGNETAAAALLAAFQADENIRLPAALALAKIAPARSVPPLVKLAVEDHAVAEEAVAALAGVLSRAGGDIAVDDLQLVVQLQRGSASKLAGILKTIDFGHVRDLAKAELMRRGVNILEDRQTSR